ncbi:hypothetical protein SEA_DUMPSTERDUDE_69 [Gordonia phage DumpsterDude]|uniref:Helix-turn-helix DNA binding domain protein n=1 Tax=Gordonia phage DumpsterDude TaxID=2713262 RepID=A0A6G8R0E6_9CAUD|nr:hypothetical protein JZX77_gp69 [Gordonia phage DumpsterDude]QIN93657.1 hypothetical protein SEA_DUMPSTERDUDE_69 [Gordonia phage DumpsterDude]
MTGRNTDHLHITHAERNKLDRELVALIDWLAEALTDTLTQQTRTGSGPRVTTGRGKEQPLPYNSRAAKVARRLRDNLNRAIIDTCHQRHLPHPGHTTLTTSWTPVPYAPEFRTFDATRLLDIQDAATWLHHPRHLIALTLTDTATTHYSAILGAISAARNAIERPREPDYVGSCTRCKGDLWGFDDDKTITCGACGLTVQRIDQDARIDRELRSRLFTARELVTIVADRLGQTIKPKTVYALTYRRGNPITVRGTNRTGDNLYLCGDVLDALTRRPRRRKQHTVSTVSRHDNH